MDGLFAPNEPSDEVRRASSGNSFAAGRFWPTAASLVGHYMLA